MSIRLTGTTMTSDKTAHNAILNPGGQPAGAGPWVPPEPEAWRVSWLPGRDLTTHQATTALVLAELVMAGIHNRWPRIESMANELGLDGADAVAKISYYGGALAMHEQPRPGAGNSESTL
jgi:hypothetical protein